MLGNDPISTPKHVSVVYRFRNIGPAKDAELEVGNLTIISGRNNTGKTYLTYTLYGFLRMWRARLLSGFLSPSLRRPLSDIQVKPNVRYNLLENGKAKFQVNDDMLTKKRSTLLKFISQEFSDDALFQVFNAPKDEFKDASIEVLYRPNNSTDINCSPIIFELDQENKIKIKREKNNVEISIDKALSQQSRDQIDLHIDEFYSVFLLHDLFPKPFILSAERFVISLFYKELDFTKNQLVDMLQKIGQTKNRDVLSRFLLIDRATSRYALPIKDNIDYTRGIPNFGKQVSAFARNRLSDHIANMMLGYYSSSGDEIRFISKDRAKGRSFNIPLHLASSSARGLSDLYFFLRHVADRNTLLIIDEPESHLDTKNQIRFARLLAHFVRFGLKILLTTHSDYLIKEVNNLIMLGQNFSTKESFMRKYKYHADDALQGSSVRAYIAEDGKLLRCRVDRFGIDMPVFDTTIDEINSVANELASAIEVEGQE